MRRYLDESRALFALAWPLVLANLVTSVLTTTDLVFIARISSESLAGASLGLSLYVPMLLFGVGLVSAVAPVIAARRGGAPVENVDFQTVIYQTALLAAVLSAIVMGLLSFGRPFLIWLGEPRATAAIAGTYLDALMFAYFPNLLFFMLRSAISALGHGGPVISTSLLAVAFNLFANWLLVPRLGVLGSGLATAASQFFMTAFLMGLMALDARLAGARLRFWFASIDRKTILEILSLGSSIGGTIVLEVSVFAITGLLMGHFGSAALAAHAIAYQWTSLGFMIPLGISQAATVRVGYAFGAKKGLIEAGRVGIVVSVLASLPIVLIGLLCPLSVISLFAKGASAGGPSAMSAVLFLQVAASFQIFNALQAAGAGVLRGVRDARWPLIVSASGYWGVGVPVGVLFAFAMGIGGAGLWLGLIVGFAAVSVALLARWCFIERAFCRRAM